MAKKSNNALRQARNTTKEMRVMAYTVSHKPKQQRKTVAVGSVSPVWEEIQQRLRSK